MYDPFLLERGETRRATQSVSLLSERCRKANLPKQTAVFVRIVEKPPAAGESRWTPERFTRWAEKIGPNTGALITTVLGSRRHPQQAFRSCLGILRLAKSYGDARLEAAARHALAIGANSYRSVESILNHRLDEHPPEPIEPAAPIEHHNIRGSDYYS